MRSPSEIVDVIKSVCKERGITVKTLELDCSLSNGQIGKWGKRNNIYPPHDKLVLIAVKLNVPVAYLTGEDEKIPAAQEGSGEDEVTDQLLSFLRSATPEEQKEIANYIEFIKSKRK